MGDTTIYEVSIDNKGKSPKFLAAEQGIKSISHSRHGSRMMENVPKKKNTRMNSAIFLNTQSS